MNYRELVRWWNPESLKHWSRGMVARVKISDSAKDFLVDVGLPKEDEETNLTFDDRSDDLPSLPAISHYRVLGFNAGHPICIDESRKGRLVLHEGGGEISERHMNAGVLEFARCLAAYREYLEKASDDPSREPDQKLIDTLEDKISFFDESAIANEESFWAVILEQLRTGLM
jgi:hypothetical protein